MKKTLISLLSLASVATAAVDSSQTLLFSFGTNSAAGLTTKTGKFMGGSNLTYNVISTSTDYGYTTEANALKWADGSTATGFTYATGAAVSGGAGQVNTITGADSVNTIFDTSVMNAVGNNDGGLTVTLTGLTSGKNYTIYTFVGRGNAYGGTEVTETNTYTLSEGAKDITASIVSYLVSTDGRPAPKVSDDGTKVTAFTQSCDSKDSTCENWAILKFDFTATSATVKLNASGGGCGNIGAVALIVPEPTTATLSLLALAGLAARRRRK